MKVAVLEETLLEKARTPGAKDKRPRRKRRATHNVLTVEGYEKGSISHPKVDFYHKLDTGDMVLVNKKTGEWSHYDNESGFRNQGKSHEDLREHLSGPLKARMKMSYEKKLLGESHYQ